MYWDVDLKDAEELYPVDESKLTDHRYLKLGAAVEHVRDLILDFESKGLKTDGLKATLRRLTAIRSSEQVEGTQALSGT